MDRRQRKTRNAIFKAFIELLENKSYNKISVGDIIERADIGRATFYAHFETKDFLLKELCEELFEHIINSATGTETHNSHYECDFGGGSVFLHLLKHLAKNEFNILGLLSSENNEIFLHYFKENLKELVISEFSKNSNFSNKKIPKDYLVNHICTSFATAVSYWISHKMKQTPEEITNYFLATIEPII